MPAKKSTRQPRTRLPQTPYGREATETLYNRYQVSRHRARINNIPFAWTAFADFVADLVELAKGTDYHPNLYKIVFDTARRTQSGDLVGYCKETMALQPMAVPSTTQMRRPQVITGRMMSPGGIDPVRLAAELAVVLATTREGSLSFVTEQALLNCGYEVFA